MTERKHIEVVAAAIFDRGRLFATQRGYGEWKDWWELPGGKMEAGETQRQALAREIREELATEVEVGDLLCTVEYDYPAFHLVMHCLRCRVVAGDLTLLEHENARWLDLGGLAQVRWLPADELALPALRLAMTQCAAERAETTLEMRHLTVEYDGRRVLDGVSATVEEGSFYALMGANGSGKSTMLRCLAGLQKPTDGEVLLGGKAVDGYAPRDRARRLAVVSQQPMADFGFEAEEIVMMARHPYRSPFGSDSDGDRAIVRSAMEQTGTWHLRHATPSHMSGGELQRVMIARALAQQTPVMLLDEPLANLDIVHQFDIMELLLRIHREQRKTVLLVVHNLNMALTYCPDLLLLHGGGIDYQGPTSAGLSPERIRDVFGVHATLADGMLRLSR